MQEPPPGRAAQGPPRKRPVRPPVRPPGQAGRRPGPPRDQPPPQKRAPARSLRKRGAAGGPPTAPPAPPAPSGPVRKRRVPGPMIVFGLAFLAALVLCVRFILVGIIPFGVGTDEHGWFPLGVMDTLLVLSFLVWPVVALWGVKQKKIVVVWGAVIAYLAVAFYWWQTPLGAQHLVMGGPFMIGGALWFTFR